MGYSVAVVERDSTLGGHVATYNDPTTGTAVDYGVQLYANTSVVRDFFDRFEVPLGSPSAGASNVYADFKTGRVFDDFRVNLTLDTYASEIARYPELSWSWNLPDPVPEDLLIPFGEFIERHNLQNSAYGMHSATTGPANPRFLDMLTVNMFKWMDETYLSMLRGGSVTTARRNNSELFAKALQELGRDALLRSTVIASQRSTGNSGVRLVVRTPTGLKLIRAARLLVTIPPLLRNMRPFDLNREEKELFGKFNYSAYYAGIIGNTGLPPRTKYINAGSDTTYNIPELPDLYSITPSAVDGIYYYWYAGPAAVSEDRIQADITAVIRRLTNNPTQRPEFIEFTDHTPFKLVVDADAIRSGFYRRLFALQGRRNTWYTGAAFCAHGTAQIWNYTYHLLPSVVGGI
jgi:hypothetical protein